MMRNGEARKAIREYYKKLLTSLYPAERLFTNRVRGVWRHYIKDGPVILIYNMDTGHVVQDSAPLLYNNGSQLIFQVLIETSDEDLIDDDLDDIGDRIEELVMTAPRPDFVNELILSASNIVINDEGDSVYGSIGLHFDVQYYSEPDYRFDELPDLNHAHSDWDGVGSNDVIFDGENA